jgi:hypothetical protein
LGLTATALPAWPSFAVGVADADGDAELPVVAPELGPDEAIAAGTVAEAVPSRIST